MTAQITLVTVLSVYKLISFPKTPCLIEQLSLNLREILWVAYECGSDRLVDLVSIEGCKDIAEFKGSINMESDR